MINTSEYKYIERTYYNFHVYFLLFLYYSYFYINK